MQAAVSRLGGTSRIVPTRLQPEASPKEAVITRNNVGIFPKMLMCGDITMATSCTEY